MNSIKMGKIVTIDGPAGSGKSTVSKALAKKLGYVYLDTGALYRALAYKALKDKISVDDQSALANMCVHTKVTLKNVNGLIKVYVDGDDVGKKIRTEEVGLAASRISTYAVVRKCLLHLQREVGAQGGLVAEGRDMGSVVFPHADYKFYLDARIEERIKRRHKELLEKGNLAEYQSIQKDMLMRDEQDKKRQLSPLKVPEDAIVIDSTNLTVSEVVGKILGYVSIK